MDVMRSSLDQATALQIRLRDCQAILAHAQVFADNRWVEGSQSFTDLLDAGGVPVGGVHIVNTSTALAVIRTCETLFRQSDLKAYDGMKAEKICGFYTAQYKRGGGGYWPSQRTQSFSPYVTGFVVKAIAHRLRDHDLAKTNALLAGGKVKNILKEQIDRLVGFLKQWSSGQLEEDLANYDHVYFAFTALEALHVLPGALMDALELDKDKVSSVRYAVIIRLRLEFYSQMAFKLAGLHQHLDAVSLILSLCSLVRHGRAETELPYGVVDAGLEAAFSLQDPGTGLWDTSEPILGAETGLVGCSSIELANWLLRTPRTAVNFERFSPCFDRLLSYLERSFDRTKPTRGWPVDIRRHGDSRQTWYGFFALEYVWLLSCSIEAHAGNLIRRGFRSSKDVPKIAWDQLADYNGYKDKVRTLFIEPRLKSPPDPAKSAMVLFGPPGCGKTSFAHALAHALSWILIEIGPGDFLSEGMDGVFSQGELIFQRLMLLKNVVALFDEIDELVAIRSTDQDKMSRFLTTFMLPWIQRLHDKGDIVFVFATNDIQRFDPAIKRTGRVDLVVPLGPPQGDDRAHIMASLGLGIAPVEITKLASEIAPCYTIGEIQAAAEEIRRQAGSVTADALRAKLSAEAVPSEKKKAWDKFIRASNSYL